MTSKGEVFPLPIDWTVEPVAKSSLSRPVRQRIAKRRMLQTSSAECVHALNHLAGSTTVFGEHSFDGLAGPNSAQKLVLSHVGKRVVEPFSSTCCFSEEAALAALLRTDSLYEVSGSVGGPEPYRAGNVSLPTDQTSATNLEALLDGEARRELLDSDDKMLLSPEELEAVLEAGVEPCYMDPCLGNSAKHYVNFVVELYNTVKVSNKK